MHDNNNTDYTDLVVLPKNPETRWVALGDDDAIISEGKTPDEAIEKAKEIAENYTLLYVPMEDRRASCRERV